MPKKSPKSQTQTGSFDQLLGWLDNSRVKAAERYGYIQNKLIWFFTARKCFDPEGLTDITIDRVISKLPEIAEDYRGTKLKYFYAVANNVYLEYIKKSTVELEEYGLKDDSAEI